MVMFSDGMELCRENRNSTLYFVLSINYKGNTHDGR